MPYFVLKNRIIGKWIKMYPLASNITKCTIPCHFMRNYFHFFSIKIISRSGLVLRIFLVPRQTSKYKKADERQVWCIVSVKEAGGCTDIIAAIRNHHILRYIKIDSIYTQLYLSPTMQFSFWCTVMFTVASFMSDSMFFFLKTNLLH